MKIEVRDIPTPTPPREYVLTLTQREADWLRTIIGSIVSPTREDVIGDSIFYALKAHTTFDDRLVKTNLVLR